MIPHEFERISSAHPCSPVRMHTRAHLMKVDRRTGVIHALARTRTCALHRVLASALSRVRQQPVRATLLMRACAFLIA